MNRSSEELMLGRKLPSVCLGRLPEGASPVSRVYCSTWSASSRSALRCGFGWANVTVFAIMPSDMRTSDLFSTTNVSLISSSFAWVDAYLQQKACQMAADLWWCWRAELGCKMIDPIGIGDMGGDDRICTVLGLFYFAEDHNIKSSRGRWKRYVVVLTLLARMVYSTFHIM